MAGNLTASPSSISFGNIILGDATSQIVTLKNTGGENVTVTAASISGTGFSFSGLTVPLTLTPNQSSTFSVTFDPVSAGAASGTMSLTVTGSANISIPLSGTGVTQGNLTANPTSMTFTNVQVGQSSSQTETVKNTGGSDAHISQVTASGTGFSFSGITPPVTLTAGQSVSFSVKFAPQSPGTFNGSITVTSDAQDPTLTIPLTGSAVGSQGTLSVTSPIGVGNVVVGTSGTANGTLTASTASVVVSSVTLSGTNPTEFSITGLSFPVTVNVGTPVSFTVHVYSDGYRGRVGQRIVCQQRIELPDLIHFDRHGHAGAGAHRHINVGSQPDWGRHELQRLSRDFSVIRAGRIRISVPLQSRSLPLPITM